MVKQLFSVFAVSQRAKESLLDLLFPPRCVNCNEFGSWFCSTCRGEIKWIRPPLCPRCGRPAHRIRLCPNCRQGTPLLVGIRAAAYFEGALRIAVHGLKYQNLQVLAEPLGRLLIAYWAENPLPVDAIVPVPLHPKRYRQRGFNQATLLARELGAAIDVPVVEGKLKRVRETTSQIGLGTEERKANVLNAFRWEGEPLAGCSILLIDDVVTTGATLEACTAPLQEAGARFVWGLTLTRGR